MNLIIRRCMKLPILGYFDKIGNFLGRSISIYCFSFSKAILGTISQHRLLISGLLIFMEIYYC